MNKKTKKQRSVKAKKSLVNIFKKILEEAVGRVDIETALFEDIINYECPVRITVCTNGKIIASTTDCILHEVDLLDEISYDFESGDEESIGLRKKWKKLLSGIIANIERLEKEEKLEKKRLSSFND